MEFSSRKREVRRIKWSEKRRHAEATVERGKNTHKNTIQERRREVVT